MDILRAVVGYAGVALFIVGMTGFLVSVLGIIVSSIQITRHGGAGLMLNDFRLLDRSKHPSEVKPHVSEYWHWFVRAALSFAFILLGGLAMRLTGVSLPG